MGCFCKIIPKSKPQKKRRRRRRALLTELPSAAMGIIIRL